MLTDELLTKLINKEIYLCVSTYACTPYHPDYIKNYTSENIDLMIDIDLFCEVLQAKIRGKIMTYASKKKRQQDGREKLLITQIEQDTQNMHGHLMDTDWMNSFKNKQDELEELREYRLKGALIRARWQQLSEGEKPTKYFLNLENRNFVSKHIRELKIGNKNISKPNEILNVMKEFYDNLYREKGNNRHLQH